MTFNKCEYCGNRYHWSHAFSKFGYNDGDGSIETPQIAELLEGEGYEVNYGRWIAHNTLIFSIKKDGMELMPLDNSRIRIGYDDPKIYLPEDIQAILNNKISRTGIFPY
jgi:uncharacterized Zn-finger protein